MFPVKPSQTTTSAALRRRSRPSTLPTKWSDGRVRQAGDVLRENRAHVRELDKMFRTRVGIRTGVDEDRGAA